MRPLLPIRGKVGMRVGFAVVRNYHLIPRALGTGLFILRFPKETQIKSVRIELVEMLPI